MLPLRYLSERQKLVLLLVAVYAVSNYFAYKHLWKDGIGIRMRTLSNADALRLRFRNNEQFYATGITIERPFDESTEAEPKIAIGLGITSKKLRNVSEDNIGTKFVFFRKFLPTFCRTASKRFTYKFYLAYDSIDRLFANQRLRDAFQRQFDSVTTSGSCRERSIIVFNMSFVQCDHAGKPTWAQNDAMLEAYIDHVDYFYRVNDDTKMVTGGWTEKFISTLKSHDPPCIGVVGPNHIGGNMGIITYDFVHRKHVDIFGFYYPRLFTDWWGDNWMTRVYKPNRSSKIRNVRLIHTMGLGQRYHTHYRVRSHLRDQLDHDITIINRYVEAMKNNRALGVTSDSRKVISMSLYGKDPRYTWGVLRNAQLIPVYLPEWTLRVYVAAGAAPPQIAVAPRIINKLRLLGAEIAKVSPEYNMLPRNWRLLAAGDQHIDYFLVRDADGRISEREVAAVNDWLSAAEKNRSQTVIHCIRDHPKHTDQAIVDGLWGGRPRALHQVLRRNIIEMITDAVTLNTSSLSNDVNALLNEVIWPAASNFSYCHDSVSPCNRWTQLASRRPFPMTRHGQEYVGQKFDAHQELLNKDGYQIKTDVICVH